ncbi:MAG TPA: hypothetical protein VFI37_15675, partial [Gaiellaceae bacterium]|nr:hypothetical protein [Gaiellaceae bacterium]
HLADLVDRAGDGIDTLFGRCAGYPAGAERTRERRLAYLRARRIPEQAVYVNTVGRTSRQIRNEGELRERLERLVDGIDGLREQDPAAIRRTVRDRVADDPALLWALEPPPGLDLRFRLRELTHMIALPLVLLVLSPLLLLGAPVFALLLRRHERSDPAPHLKPPPKLVQELAALEDHLVQNPFSAIGFVKPGRFRRLTLRGVLYVLDYATRHVFNRENLAGVKTIHFARWVVLDGGRRVIFASNYDGSLESYMDDFVDKIAWGLNVAFSNGYGFPRTRWLFLDGARDELAFKDYLKLHQVPTRVWYSAYGRLTNANIARNARIRDGLRRELGPEEAARWVQAL